MESVQSALDLPHQDGKTVSDVADCLLWTVDCGVWSVVVRYIIDNGTIVTRVRPGFDDSVPGRSHW